MLTLLICKVVESSFMTKEAKIDHLNSCGKTVRQTGTSGFLFEQNFSITSFYCFVSERITVTLASPLQLLFPYSFMDFVNKT